MPPPPFVWSRARNFEHRRPTNNYTDESAFLSDGEVEEEDDDQNDIITTNEDEIENSTSGYDSTVLQTLPTRNEARDNKDVKVFHMGSTLVGKDCNICLEKLHSNNRYQELLCTPCSHIFHKKCIERWFDKNKVCPLCRSAIPI
ncbi:E3 ubiquitin-protein ligase BIG BROTHER-like [Humulus lupulus]|uniref:E3 ubiquitin-protein ligase BIG BROTHER-like n=1 Tax=Humulus lupulus TaxID=3486 RepID=UPI002B407E95|nr:E3 ubiquitin-protein ligase BIG BROTHER-like [Humulus lupulus]